MALYQQLAINAPNKIFVAHACRKNAIALESYCPLAPSLDYLILH